MEWLIIACLGIFLVSVAQVFLYKRSERGVKKVKKEIENLEIEKTKFLPD
ncbi:MAG: hypothetical protein QFX37_03430 [Archaeoglobales archaeon]|nr:hypothetical protein [Archaeoglobales archaeon]